MGLELAEQLGWELPDVVLYPTGGGTGLIGMWKAFAELEAIGFIGKKRPRMVAVQAAGCAPIVRAYDAGVEHAPRWEDAQTIAAGIRVPQAIGDFLMLRAVRESGGFAIAVTDEAITAAIDEVARAEGLLLCPEGAATYAALKQSLADGRIRRDERALLFNCATGLKYPMPPVEPYARSLAADRFRDAVIRTIHVISGRRAMTKLIMAAAIAALVAIIGGAEAQTLSVSSHHHDRAVSRRRPFGCTRTRPRPSRFAPRSASRS